MCSTVAVKEDKPPVIFREHLNYGQWYQGALNHCFMTEDQRRKPTVWKNKLIVLLRLPDSLEQAQFLHMFHIPINLIFIRVSCILWLFKDSIVFISQTSYLVLKVTKCGWRVDLLLLGDIHISLALAFTGKDVMRSPKAGRILNPQKNQAYVKFEAIFDIVTRPCNYVIIRHIIHRSPKRPQVIVWKKQM